MTDVWFAGRAARRDSSASRGVMRSRAGVPLPPRHPIFLSAAGPAPPRAGPALPRAAKVTSQVRWGPGASQERAWGGEDWGGTLVGV